MSELVFLVDYENVPRATRRMGLRSVAERLLLSVPFDRVADGDRARMRLYGGWYEGSSLTRFAQELVAKIEEDFPWAASISVANVRKRVTVIVELAYSTEHEPTRHLFHTMRSSDAPSGLCCRVPSVAGCATDPCPLAQLEPFINGGSCPNPQCDLTVESLLFLRQQKLVDAMLLVDIMHVGSRTDAQLIVVTSDTDLAPGIRAAVIQGADLIHVRPRPLSAVDYWGGLGDKYTVAQLVT